MIIVLGYYDRSNLGDDIFARMWPWLLQQVTTDDVYVGSLEDPIEQLPLTTPRCIILGGGDLINEYFLNRLVAVLRQKNWTHVPVHGLSLGFTSLDAVETQFLKLLTTVDLRSQQQFQAVQAALATTKSTTRVSYHPDISLYLKNMLPAAYGWANKLKPYPLDSTISDEVGDITAGKQIGMFLARSAFVDNPNYGTLVANIALLCKSLLARLPAGSVIHLIPFNTDELNKIEENDILFNQDVADAAADCTHIQTYTDAFTIEEMASTFRKLDFAFCMRYHAHMMAVVYQIPFISFSMTVKTEQLMTDIGRLDALYKMPIDAQRKPTGIDVDAVLDMFDQVGYMKPPVEYKDYPLTSYQSFLESVVGAPRAGGQPHTEYQYGMEQKMTSSTVNIVSEIDWVLKDWQSKLKPKSWPNYDEHTGPHDTPNPVHPNGVPTFKRVVPLSPSPNPHRAGWKYAMESIECYNDDVNGDVLFDDYIDRSFHWCYDLFESTGTIPYRRKWFGFIHHTLNTGTSPNNVGALFEKPLFLQSLDTCMLLITMSSALKADVIKLLAEHNKSHVKVINMIHPTLMHNIPLFNLEHYYQNEGVVNVGAWLRNPFSIYTLQLNPGVSKYALRGQSMDDNFAPEDFVVSGMSISRGVYTCYSVSDGSIVELNSSNRDVCFQNMCRNNKQTFIQSSLESLIAQVHSVQVIEHQNDEAYDRLLTAKVVFLDLIDAAAVNTVVECIVRNTPIIVNRLPALEEYLGQDYPLFYYDLSEVNNLLTRIPDAHQYLVSKSKAEFHVDTFRARFAEVLKALAGASV